MGRKYFDGYASFNYNEMTKEKLIFELKEKIQYIGTLKKEITDLEKKTTKIEKQHLLDEIEWQNYCAFKHIEPQIKGCLDRERELKQQLAEKDKEIISLECVISEIHNDIKELHEFKVGEDEYDLTDSDARFSLECELLNKDQDKISFAIEQLEKVKEYLTQELENVTELLDPLEYEDYHEFIGCGRGYKNSIEEIDNQIKTLRGEK